GGAESRDGGESVFGRIGRDVLDSPRLGGALGRLLGVRARATQAQEMAMGLLNVPTSGDIERLTRRVRSLSDRLGAIEDSLARIDGTLRRHNTQLSQRLAAIEKELAATGHALASLESTRASGEPIAVSRDQEALIR
ncbi:MAG TPA: hypothetical protein VL977_01435, partial [Solirubrobacteraceae bacterium]|nr:hypothetical protein [Solirubrobacteraceae bacterium]